MDGGMLSILKIFNLFSISLYKKKFKINIININNSINDMSNSISVKIEVFK